MRSEDPVLLPSVAAEPLGIAAGGGTLPRIVADAAVASGWSPRVLAIADGVGADWAPYESRIMPWGRLGNGMAWLKAEGVRRMVLCGTVAARPDFRSIVPSLRTLFLLPRIMAVIRGGDDNLLRAAAAAFAEHGLSVIAVQDIAPRLLAPAGVIAGRRPTEEEEAAIRRGFDAARVLGLLDAGQAVVASPDRIVALEGVEGTREMLARVADLRARGRLGRNERCVLVKAFKPRQDNRFDLPSIGPSTVEEAASAGLTGIAVSARHSLIIGLDDTSDAAVRHGLFIIGRTETAS